MIDVTTNQPLRAEHVSGIRSFLRLPVSQLESVRRVLDSRGFSYWVSEHFLSFNGGPETTTIYFAPTMDPKAIQSALDEVR